MFARAEDIFRVGWVGSLGLEASPWIGAQGWTESWDQLMRAGLVLVVGDEWVVGEQKT